jgi:5'-methylthioadenosine phosphorylase
VIAIIGGTGVGRFPLDDDPIPLTVETPYGAAAVETGRLRGKKIVFLARHGAGHRVPPHRINYRANIAALWQLGVRAVLATTAAGGLNIHLKTGDLVLLDDLIDFTRDRSGKTFFDGEGEAPVVHTDFTFPYSPALRGAVLAAANSLGIPLQGAGTYLCNDGPRYETPAEVRLFAAWGADVVGMTGVPEATLAREAGLHYAGISLVTNLAAGLSPEPLTHTEVEAAMAQAGPLLRTLLVETVARVDEESLPPVGPGTPLPRFIHSSPNP